MKFDFEEFNIEGLEINSDYIFAFREVLFLKLYSNFEKEFLNLTEKLGYPKKQKLVNAEIKINKELKFLKDKKFITNDEHEIITAYKLLRESVAYEMYFDCGEIFILETDLKKLIKYSVRQQLMGCIKTEFSKLDEEIVTDKTKKVTLEKNFNERFLKFSEKMLTKLHEIYLIKNEE